MNEATPNSSTPVHEADLSGQRLGDYELIRRLGRGAMADVYLARQASLGRQVAIKVLRPSLASDDKYVRRFHQEARAAASLVHANIVQIHEVGCIDGVHFIAQEYVPGHNLRQHLQRNGPLDARLAVRVIRQVAAALHRSAQAQIIHRDIKPENIMMSTTGEVKVADFGLARVAVGDQGLDLTQIGVTMGTPLYMSPEQVEGRAVDPRSDVYSLGVTCFHVLVGRPPFTGETALSVAVQHLQQEPERLESLRKDLPPGLCRIVHRMLRKDPAERYQTPSELLKDLRNVRLEGGDEEWPAGSEDWSDPELIALSDGRWEATTQLAAVMKDESRHRLRSRRRLASVVLFTLIGLAGGVALGWYWRPAPLLHVPATDRPRIQQRATVEEQYAFASLVNSEAALKSVSEYFDPRDSAKNRLYARRALRNLGELYLSRGDLDQAMQVFTELAEVEESEVSFRAIGLLGQAVVYSQRGERDQAASKLAQVPDSDPNDYRSLVQLLDPELRERWWELRSADRPGPGPFERPRS